MNELLYLTDKLSKRLYNDDGLEVSDEKISEIIKVYDRLYSFLQENQIITGQEYKYRYNFVLSDDRLEDDDTNYEIFKSLIELERFKGLYILHLPTVFEKINGTMYHFYLTTECLSKLDCLLSLYLTYFYNDDEIEENYIVYHNDSLESIINNYLGELMASKYVSDNDKVILKKFDDLFYRAHSDEFSGYIDDINYFLSFLNIAYAYFVANDKLVHEYDKIIDFLDKIDLNFKDFLDKISVSGIETDDEVLKFMKNIYEQGATIKKKQIK